MRSERAVMRSESTAACAVLLVCYTMVGECERTAAAAQVQLEVVSGSSPSCRHTSSLSSQRCNE